MFGNMNHWKPTLKLLAIGMLVPLIGACSHDDSVDTDSGSDSYSDADADSDTDTDTDADTDSETDTDDEVFDHIYDVGPGQAYEDPSEVPWESLEPSTLVRIHHRPQPYAHKWVINTAGTADKPLVVLGVLSDGERPVITGENAVTREALNYWNEVRSVIKIGGSNLPTDDVVPAYVRVENLDIRSARPAYQFTDHNGETQTYASNAAAIHIEIGEHITVRNCLLHDSGNGLFSGHQSSHVVIEANHVYDNGIDDSIYEHNSYTESFGILFQYNHYGPLRTGCLGNNLKDRSAGTVIRYNWIASGNRQLDLVESDYEAFVSDPSYAQTFVYGNILVEPDGAGNSQIIHYGGDGGDEVMYRKGVLYLYNNTVVSTRSGNTTLMRLSTDQESADVRNNILFSQSGGSRLAICSGSGTTDLQNNWISQGWVDTHEGSMSGEVNDLGNEEGEDPGFEDLNAQQFKPNSGSACIDQGGDLASQTLPGHNVKRQYIPHQKSAPRPKDQKIDIGAFERD